MIEIKEKLLAENNRLRSGGKYKKKYITIHSTSNEKSTAENERAWLENKSNTRNASWHYAVDENYIIQALPDEEEAWHCGTEEGNKHSISIEICESGDRKAAVDNAVCLTAKKMREHSIPLENIKQHFQWNGKNCPRILRDEKYVKNGIDWQYFMEEVKKRLESDREMVYRSVEEIPEWAKATVKKLTEKGYIAGDEKGNLNLSEMAVKVLVINDRAGLYG